MILYGSGVLLISFWMKDDEWIEDQGLLPQKNLMGVCGPLPKTLTLFMTKTWDIPYPIHILTKNSKP